MQDYKRQMQFVTLNVQPNGTERHEVAAYTIIEAASISQAFYGGVVVLVQEKQLPVPLKSLSPKNTLSGYGYSPEWIEDLSLNIGIQDCGGKSRNRLNAVCRKVSGVGNVFNARIHYRKKTCPS